MPTYDELQKDLKKNGITLSKYDDYYAQNDPNFGYNIMNAKLDYMNAATPEQRRLPTPLRNPTAPSWATAAAATARATSCWTTNRQEVSDPTEIPAARSSTSTWATTETPTATTRSTAPR